MLTFQEPDSNVPVGSPMPDSHLGLHYNDAGSAFSCDADGTWIPHYGYALVHITWSVRLTLLTSFKFFYSVSCSHGSSAKWTYPRTLLPESYCTRALVHWLDWSLTPSGQSEFIDMWVKSCYVLIFDQQFKPGSLWMLSMLFSFMPCPDHKVTPSAMLLPHLDKNPLDPTAIPLLQSCNANLSVPHVIAQAQGHDPSPKITGACHHGVTVLFRQVVIVGNHFSIHTPSLVSLYLQPLVKADWNGTVRLGLMQYMYPGLSDWEQTSFRNFEISGWGWAPAFLFFGSFLIKQRIESGTHCIGKKGI